MSTGAKVALIVGVIVAVVVVAVAATAFILGTQQAINNAANMPSVTSATITVTCQSCAYAVYGGSYPHYTRMQFSGWISNSRWLSGDNGSDIESIAGNSTSTYLLTRTNTHQLWSIGWDFFPMVNASPYGGTITVVVVLNTGVTVFDHSVTFTSSDLGSSKVNSGSWST
jgi:hypothetical protein